MDTRHVARRPEPTRSRLTSASAECHPSLFQKLLALTQNWLYRVRYVHDATKEEPVDYADFTDFSDAVRQIAQWIAVEYNTQQIQSALRYATLAEFEMAAHPRVSLSG